MCGTAARMVANHRGEIGGDHPLPELGRDVLDGACGIACAVGGEESRRGGDAGIGEHDIEPPARGGRAGDGLLERLMIRHVDGISADLRAVRAEHSDGLVKCAAVGIDERDARPIGCHNLCVRQAYASRAAGDDNRRTLHAEERCGFNPAEVEHGRSLVSGYRNNLFLLATGIQLSPIS